MPPSISRASSQRGRQSLALDRNPSIHSHNEGSTFGGIRRVLTGGSTLKGSVIGKNKTRRGSKSSKVGGSALPPTVQYSDLGFPINEHQSYNPHQHHHHATDYSMYQNAGHNGRSAKAEGAANFFGVFLSLLRWKKKLILKTKGKEEPEPMMACPFFRLDPFRYQRCFGKYELRRFSDVKQHLERCHSPGSYYCNKCQTRWTKPEGWREHTKEGCNGQPIAPDLDKIPLDKLERLKKMPRGATDDAKYRIMWESFFPGPCPDPFLRDLPTEAASQLRQFQERSLRQHVIPSLLQKHGVVLDAKKAQDLASEILAEAYNPKHARTPAPIYRRGTSATKSLPPASPQPEGGAFASNSNVNSQLLHDSPEQLQQGFQVQEPRIKPELSLQCDMDAIQPHQPQPQSLMEPLSAHSMVHSPTVSIGEGLHHVDSVDGTTTMNSAGGGFHHHFSQQPSVDSYLSPVFTQMSQHSQHFDNVSPTTVNLPIHGGPSGSGGPPSLISGARSFDDSWLSSNPTDLDGGAGPMTLDDAAFTVDDLSQHFGMQANPTPGMIDATPGIMVYPPAANLSFPKCFGCESGLNYQYCQCQSHITPQMM